jgi:hypothetical protein
MKKLLMLVAAGLFFAGFAAADTIVDPVDITTTTDLEAEIEALFGSSMTWTTAGNVAEIDYWLSLVTSLGGDDTLLEPELEIILGIQGSSQVSPTGAASTDESPSDNPEPATLVLLGGGLILLWGATTNSSIRRLLNTF